MAGQGRRHRHRGSAAGRNLDDKVDTEIPSPSAGTISKLVAEEGQTLPVGAVIAVIEKAGAAAQPTKPAAKPAPEPEAPPAPKAPAPMQEPAQVAASAPEERTDTGHRRYSPVVVRMAAEHGLDIERIPGTGIGGRVSKRDVLKYLESLRSSGPSKTPQAPVTSNANGAAAAPATLRPAAEASRPMPTLPTSVPVTGGYHPPVYQPREGDVVEAFTRRRKLIAEHMVYSKTHSPHVGTLA